MRVSALRLTLVALLLAASRAPAETPNIVVIMADDLGYGDVACYNASSKIATPHIDALAAHGVRFTDAHSPSAVCTPTRYGLLTGRYCWRTWLKSNVVGGYTPPLIEPTRTTIASYLRDNGYTTGCFGKWHLGLGWQRANGFVGTHENARANFGGSWQDGDPAKGMNVDFSKPIHGGPTALGFDTAFFTAACSTIDGPFCFIRDDRTVGLPDRMIPLEDYGGRDLRPRKGWMVEGFDLTTVDLAFTNAAIDFMTNAATTGEARPFFVYLALSSPHAPWLPPTLTAGTTDEGPRGDLVAVVDHCVGQITAALARLGVAEDTLLVFTSDNGPRIGANGHRSSGDLRGYKTHAWEGGHRVPFIARWPGRIDAATTSTEPIELTDLLATSAAIVGAPLPDEAGPDSYDILPALLGEAGDTPIREAIVSHSQAGVFVIRQGRWKLIVETEGSGGWVAPSGDGPKAGAPGQLYDLASDPRETTNLFDEHPGIVARLSDLLAGYRTSGRSAPTHETNHTEPIAESRDPVSDPGTSNSNHTESLRHDPTPARRQTALAVARTGR
jgi:arylsulfatase A-like enzyme